MTVPVPLPAAPPGAAAAALGLGAAAALLLPDGPPGVGVALLALLGTAVLLRAAPLGGWQRVHLALALALAASAALRDAAWLVALALLAALVLGALALRPLQSWAGLLGAPLRLALRALPATPWLLRGLRPLLLRTRGAGPAAVGAVLTGALLLVFVPLLASADAGFARLQGSLVPRVEGVDLLVARVVLVVVVATGVAAAASLVLLPAPEPSVGPPGRRLERTAEWLPPLAALDLLLAAFLLAQGRPADDVRSTYADAVHAGFWQLVAVTVLVLAVVAAAARWTPGGTGVRAACGALCVLTLAVDASALLRLQAYVDAYGLTRLRIGVAAVCLLLAAVLVAVLLAGAVAAVARALPHVLVVLAAASLLVLTGTDPDDAVARSALSRGAAADTAYLATLSADAVPALDRLPEPARSCVLAGVAARLAQDRPWTSANRARARAADVLRARPLLPCG